MAAFIASRNDQVVEVEPHVHRAIMRIAGLTLLVSRTGTDEAPTVSVEVWPNNGEGESPLGSVTVAAPADLDRDPAVLEWYRARARANA